MLFKFLEEYIEDITERTGEEKTSPSRYYYNIYFENYNPHHSKIRADVVFML